MTLANCVWLEAQRSTNDIPRRSGTVTGWARPKASETFSADRQMMPGCGLRGRIEITPISQCFLSPRTGMRDTGTCLPIFQVRVIFLIYR